MSVNPEAKTLPAVKVSLGFAVRSGILVPEAEAPAWFAANPAALLPGPEQEGVVAIGGAAGEPVPVGDVVLWMVPALCFDAVKGLLDHGAATVDAFSNDTHVELRRDGETVQLACSGEFPLDLPALPLAEALFAAGERFIALVGRLWPEQADQLLADVRPREAAARASLSRHSPAGVG